MGLKQWTRRAGSGPSAVRALRGVARPARGVTRHSHGRDHLASGGLPRCGCGPEVLMPVDATEALSVDDRATWRPVRRQLTGFVRTRTVYSTRTLVAFR